MLTYEWINFDVPGHASGSFQGTSPYGMNSNGDIVGQFDDAASGQTHGFLRTFDGTITVFTVSGSDQTQPSSINDSGYIVGAYRDAVTHVFKGFVRAPNGTITTFAPPDNSTSAFKGVSIAGLGHSLNNHGIAIGEYTNTSNAVKGFIYDIFAGTFWYFTTPVGGFSGNRIGINNQIPPEFTGTYAFGSPSFLSVAFVGTSGGSVSGFQAPLAATGTFQGTFAYDIDEDGSIVGYYIDSLGHNYNFLRNPAGTTYTNWSPDPTTSTQMAPGIENGFIVSDYEDTTQHVQIRDTDGTLTYPYDDPSADPGFSHGTLNWGTCNASKMFAGYYLDSSAVQHGYLAIPFTCCYELEASPTTITVEQGNHGAITIAAITVSGGCGEIVDLSISTLPFGVTSVFSPSAFLAVSGYSILTLTVGVTTPIGSYPLTIESLCSNVPITLMVVAPASDVTTITRPHQPSTVPFVVGDSINTWYARAKHTDIFGEGPWTTITIPQQDLIDSGFSRGQGSIIPSLDGNVSALFTYTATSQAGGGANSGEVVIVWPDFTLEYSNNDQQFIPGGLIDSGKFLTSNASSPTTYNVFPYVAPVDNSPVLFDNPTNVSGGFCIPNGSVLLATAAGDVQKDGRVSLAGTNLSFPVIVPAAGGGGGSGGGGGGGSQCIVVGEKLTIAKDGEKPVESVSIGNFAMGMNPYTGLFGWNSVNALAYSEEDSIEVILQDGASMKVSKSTPCPVKMGKDIREIKAYKLNGDCLMYSKKSSDWISIAAIISLGPRRVVRVSLEPAHWMFVNEILSHNNRVDKTG